MASVTNDDKKTIRKWMKKDTAFAEEVRKHGFEMACSIYAKEKHDRSRTGGKASKDSVLHALKNSYVESAVTQKYVAVRGDIFAATPRFREMSSLWEIYEDSYVWHVLPLSEASLMLSDTRQYKIVEQRSATRDSASNINRGTGREEECTGEEGDADEDMPPAEQAADCANPPSCAPSIGTPHSTASKGQGESNVHSNAAMADGEVQISGQTNMPAAPPKIDAFAAFRPQAAKAKASRILEKKDSDPDDVLQTQSDFLCQFLEKLQDPKFGYPANECDTVVRIVSESQNRNLVGGFVHEVANCVLGSGTELLACQSSFIKQIIDKSPPEEKAQSRPIKLLLTCLDHETNFSNLDLKGQILFTRSKFNVASESRRTVKESEKRVDAMVNSIANGWFPMFLEVELSEMIMKLKGLEDPSTKKVLSNCVSLRAMIMVPKDTPQSFVTRFLDNWKKLGAENCSKIPAAVKTLLNTLISNANVAAEKCKAQEEGINTKGDIGMGDTSGDGRSNDDTSPAPKQEEVEELGADVTRIMDHTQVWKIIAFLLEYPLSSTAVPLDALLGFLASCKESKVYSFCAYHWLENAFPAPCDSSTVDGYLPLFRILGHKSFPIPDEMGNELTEHYKEVVEKWEDKRCNSYLKLVKGVLSKIRFHKEYLSKMNERHITMKREQNGKKVAVTVSKAGGKGVDSAATGVAIVSKGVDSAATNVAIVRKGVDSAATGAVIVSKGVGKGVGSAAKGFATVAKAVSDGVGSAATNVSVKGDGKKGGGEEGGAVAHIPVATPTTQIEATGEIDEEDDLLADSPKTIKKQEEKQGESDISGAVGTSNGITRLRVSESILMALESSGEEGEGNSGTDTVAAGSSVTQDQIAISTGPANGEDQEAKIGISVTGIALPETKNTAVATDPEEAHPGNSGAITVAARSSVTQNQIAISTAPANDEEQEAKIDTAVSDITLLETKNTAAATDPEEVRPSGEGDDAVDKVVVPGDGQANSLSVTQSHIAVDNIGQGDILITVPATPMDGGGSSVRTPMMTAAKRPAEALDGPNDAKRQKQVSQMNVDELKTELAAENISFNPKGTKKELVGTLRDEMKKKKLEAKKKMTSTKKKTETKKKKGGGKGCSSSNQGPAVVGEKEKGDSALISLFQDPIENQLGVSGASQLL